MAPNIVSVFAPAKINLYFDILSKRIDGYHEILTLFQAVDLHDVLTFEFLPLDNARIMNSQNLTEIVLLEKNYSIEKAHFPLNSKNSIAQAIDLFLSHLQKKTNISIKVKVEKEIPIGAGLAGGSTDAAAALLALNHYFDKPFNNEALLDLAAQVGSDVSFCLLGGTAIGSGRGEKLEALNEKPNYHFVLVKPRELSISTPWAYSVYDQFIVSEAAKTIKNRSINQLLSALKLDSQVKKQADLFWNAFQPAIFKEHLILANIKKYLENLGCISVHLTGSGPTIYGLVENEEEGKKVLNEIKRLSTINKKDSLVGEIQLDSWLTKSLNKGVHIISSRIARNEH